MSQAATQTQSRALPFARARRPLSMRLTPYLALPLFGAMCAAAQQAPVATVSTQGVVLHGAMSVADGRAAIGNNGEVAAEDKTVQVALNRGGLLSVCTSTAVRIARDRAPASPVGADDTGLMFSLDRGALEAHYTPSAYSDVIMTPDLRILISPPGVADLKLRVNEQGDTCVDNSGKNAPYVIASSLMDGGAYRIRPGQRVLFVQGSLSQVVDNETEPCGCPAAAPPTQLASSGTHPGGPSSTAADTTFPTAVSEGLQAPPRLSGPPVVPEGTAHAEVSATLSSSSPPGPPPDLPQPATPLVKPSAPATAPAAAITPEQPQSKRGFFGKVGHFFAKVFGAGE